MAAKIVNNWVRDAGVWKRATPWVKDAGVWKKAQKAYARDSGSFKVTWADALRALSPTGAAAFTVNNVDFMSPFSTGGGYRLLINGAIQTFDNPPSAVFTTDLGLTWLTYDAGHVFQVAFFPTSAISLDNTPTLSVFLDLDVSRTISTDNIGLGIESGAFSVQFQDKNNPGALIAHVVSISTQNEPL